MTKLGKIKIFIAIAVLLSTQITVSLVSAQTCPGIQYATGGCGGVGGGGVGPSGLTAVSCRQCACWCGWAECCYLPAGETPKAAGRADFLFSSATQQCGCSSPGGTDGSSAGTTEETRTTPPTKEEVQGIVARSLGKFQYKGGESAFNVGPDGIAQTNCSGMTSYWWHQLGLPDVGDVGVSIELRDTDPYYVPGVTMDQLNPGDQIFKIYGEPGNITGAHIGMYIGDGLVAHMANPEADLVIETVEIFWDKGGVNGVARVPGY